MDITAWLRELGLERYERAFREGEIDADILPELTDADLKELGIPLGPRKKLAKAISILGTGPRQRTVQNRNPSEAERRQLTVMFVDLVGSTELSTMLDPEELREVIRAYQDSCAGVISRFEGFVANFMGDGVLAYFGYPRTHEDEAERAVRAALTLTDTVGNLPSPTDKPLAVRIGIATGLVVVGDLVGEGAAQEQAVVGETPNLAARLQTLAEPDQVAIAPTTRELIGTGFECKDLGKHELKGFSEPLQAFLVTGERTTPSRFDSRGGTLLPLIGRDQELSLILERWKQAKDGEGQGILVTGEAGIGKSRISHALLDSLSEPHTRIRYQCSPFHTDSALWPVIRQLSDAVRTVTNDSNDTRLDKLEALLVDKDPIATALLSDLIGLDVTSRYESPELTPEARRARTLHALVDQLLALAERQPVLVVLEDAHWIDPTTLELIEQGLDRIADARVLILLTSRPDKQPLLTNHPHLNRLTLNRLSRAAVEAMVGKLTEDRPLPTEMTEAIISRTDGVPLFVEELAKAVLETGEATVPASLHDSLLARLDRTPNVKEIAQIAACIGRTFDYALLATIVDRPTHELKMALSQLVKSGLMFCRGEPPEARYTFKHALVRDAAYETLLKSMRQQLHARIALILEQSAQHELELLAHHHTQAANTIRAIECWLEAGLRAGKSSANVEAISRLGKGLQIVQDLPDGSDRDRYELRFHLARIPSLMATVGYIAKETVDAYRQARALCKQLGDDEPLLRLLHAEWAYIFTGPADHRACEELGRQILLLGEDQGDTAGILTGHRLLGNSQALSGRFADALSHFDRSVSLYEPKNHAALTATYGHDPWVQAESFRSWCLWHLGYPEKAEQSAESALDRAWSLKHRNSIGYVLLTTSLTADFSRDKDLVAHRILSLLSLAKEQQLTHWLKWGQIMEGWLQVLSGRLAKGIALMERSLGLSEEADYNLYRSYFLSLLARAHEQSGQTKKGLEVIEQALDLLAATNECFCEAELYRIKGALMLTDGRRFEARTYFEQSISVAQQQSARSLELRATTHLARLYSDQGEQTKALDLLAPVYEWFCEGFDTVDLIDAKLLLNELA